MEAYTVNDNRRFIPRLLQLASEGMDLIAKLKAGTLPLDAALEQIASQRIKARALTQEMVHAGWTPPPLRPDDSPIRVETWTFLVSAPDELDEDPAEIERRDHEKRQQAIEDRHQDERDW